MTRRLSSSIVSACHSATRVLRRWQLTSVISSHRLGPFCDFKLNHPDHRTVALETEAVAADAVLERLQGF